MPGTAERIAGSRAAFAFRGVAVVIAALACVLAAPATKGVDPVDQPGAVEQAAPVERGLERAFADTVLPFVAGHCAECHADGAAEGDLDLGAFATMADVDADVATGIAVEHGARAARGRGDAARGGVEPSDAGGARRRSSSGFARCARTWPSKNAGDPGVVLARRLSNAEYNYTIRDLTGVDIRPTDEFPVDPGEPGGLRQLGRVAGDVAGAAQEISRSGAAAWPITSCCGREGIAFAPHPVVANTDRDKYCVLRIVDFYHRQPTDVADVPARGVAVQAPRGARASRRRRSTTIAADAKVSPQYLATVWEALEDADRRRPARQRCRRSGGRCRRPTTRTRRIDVDAVRAECVEIRDWIVDAAAEAHAAVRQPAARRRRPRARSRSSCGRTGSTPTHRMTYDPGGAAGRWRRRAATEDDERDDEATMTTTTRRERRRPIAASRAAGAAADPDLFVPADAGGARPLRSVVRASSAACSPTRSTSPSAAGRTWIFEKQKQDKGRLLTAGFHNSHGYFRDDQPLYELILDDAGRRELDELWLELDFIAFAPERQHADFIFYERAESKTIPRPGVRLRPLRGQGRRVGSQDPAARRGLSRQGPREPRGERRRRGGDSRDRDVSSRNVNANIRRVEQARLDGGAEPPGSARRRSPSARIAGRSPTRSATSWSRSTARCATRASSTTRPRSATRW